MSEPQTLARYAMHLADSAGRVHPEPPHPYRNPYQRDRDRIVHCSAFRRLAHKTQVFTGSMGDYHRSRLTHTLEVASIARTLGRTLRLNEDLIEALALAHDIGHPPFGHAGEDALNECLADHGGFNHNRQALRIVELLESRYPDFPGLNLTREVLDGQRARAEKNAAGAAPRQRLLEAQIVDAADNIAYDAHDPDDAVELGLLDVEQLNGSALWRTAAERARRRYAALDDKQFRRVAVHELIDLLVTDLLAATSRRLAEDPPESHAEVLAADSPYAVASADITEQQAELEGFLLQHVYRHPLLRDQRTYAARALREMFDWMTAEPGRLPAKFAAIAEREGLGRAAADYLAGMTDRFALEEYERLAQGSA